MKNFKKTLKFVSIFLILMFLLFNFTTFTNATYSSSTTDYATLMDNLYQEEEDSICYTTMNLETQEETDNVFQASEVATASEFTSNHTDSYIPEHAAISPSSIIGGDERFEVSSPSTFPNSTVAYLEAEFPDGTLGIGTAFVWYKDLALTAGHCIYDSEHGGWATKVTIWPGKKGYGLWNNPYGTAQASQMHISTSFMNNGTASEDWGLLELNSDIGNNCGWRGIAYSEDYSGFLNQNVTLPGYPSSHRYYQHQATGPVKITSSTKLYYDIDTERGQSGSPIWDSAGYCIGIHVHGTYDGMPWNSCTNITKSKFEFFKSKMN